jgi:hypothetical protein
MIWNTIPNEEKLRLWKKMRDQIQEFPLEDQYWQSQSFAQQSHLEQEHWTIMVP